MSTTLSQSSQAAFPDRGHVGLLVSFEAGLDGSFLAHELASEQSRIHVRLLLGPATAQGGKVRLAGGQNDDAQPGWWIEYDTDARQVRLELATGDTIDAPLNALPWHCLEVMVDAAEGEAALRINGLPAGTATGSFAALTTRSVWVGGVFKEHALVGALHLDEWCISADWIGPARTTPTSEHADDPARWLVVYNAADDDAVTWAEAYRQARRIPFANLLGLQLSMDEVIDGAAYADLAQAIADYLDHTGLSAQVIGILAGYRVPGYVAFQPGELDAVAALLHRGHAGPGWASNDNAADALPVRPTRALLDGDRLTARLDAPDLPAALALIERATIHRQGSLEGDAGARLWFDPLSGDGAAYSSRTTEMIAWARSLDCQRTRLPIELSGDLSQPTVPAAFEQVHHDAIFWGWAAPAPPEGFFAQPAGARVFCAQLHVSSAVATTVRAALPGNWIDVPIAAGYAAAAATSRNCSVSAVPHPRPFFEALRQGWTLAEAWHLALPLLREGFYLVGDPLMTASLPRRGWDLFGPLRRLEELDPSTSSHAMPESVDLYELPDPLRPALGEQATYLLRHVDDLSRSETSLALARGVNQAGQFTPLPLSPLWPDRAHWPAHVEQSQVVLLIAWGQPLSTCHVQRVQLIGQVDDQGAVVLHDAAPDPRTKQLEVRQPLPTTHARYCWRVLTPEGVAVDTPWSQWIEPRAATSHALTLLEVRP